MANVTVLSWALSLVGSAVLAVVKRMKRSKERANYVCTDVGVVEYWLETMALWAALGFLEVGPLLGVRDTSMSAVEAYSDAILEGDGYREAVNAFWWRGVLEMAVFACLQGFVVFLTVAYASDIGYRFRKAKALGIRPAMAALAVVPIPILAVLAVMVMATVLWILGLGLWITG